MWATIGVVLLAAAAFQFQCVVAISLEEGPQSQIIAYVGETVVFNCDFKDVGERAVLWQYYDETTLSLSFNRAIYRRVPDALKTRLSVIGDINLEQFNLRLADVRVSDSGTYSCQYAFNGGIATNAGRSILTVVSPPSIESPECRVEPVSGAVTSMVGDIVVLHCESVAGTPSPQLAYKRANSDDVLIGPTTSNISFQYQLRAEDNGIDFICVMTTPALNESRHCSVQPLRILPRALVTPSMFTILQGDGASFYCDGYGEPNIISYRWAIQNTNTGRNLLPTYRYKVSDNGKSVEILAIQENITVICYVTTSNGLTANSTGLVKIYEQATINALSTTEVHTTLFADIVSTSSANLTVPTEPNATRQSVTDLTKMVPIPVPFIIAIVPVFLGSVFAITICICCMRHRRNKRGLVPPADYPMTERGNTYEEVPDKPHKEQSSNLEVQSSPHASGQLSSLGAQQSSPATTSAAAVPLYASPNKPRRGVPQSEPELFFPKSYVPLYATPNRIRNQATDDKSMASIPTDTCLYAQPKRRSKKKIMSTVTWGLDKNGYSIVKRDDIRQPDSSVVYADLEMKAGASSGSATESSKDLVHSPVKEKTVYAQILS